MTQQMDNSTEDQAPSKRGWRWAAIGIGALVLGLLAGWLILKFFPVPYTYHGTVIQSPQTANNFTLTGKDGRPISLADFRGQAVMLYFGYTFCPDVCPATMVELAKAKDALGDDSDKVQVIMISVDPERDTPEILNEYVTHFNPSFIGLTGTADEVASAATPFGIFYEKHEGSAASGYLIDHTASVIVVDPEGYIRLVYSFNTPGEDMAEDLKRLVN